MSSSDGLGEKIKEGMMKTYEFLDSKGKSSPDRASPRQVMERRKSSIRRDDDPYGTQQLRNGRPPVDDDPYGTADRSPTPRQRPVDDDPYGQRDRLPTRDVDDDPYGTHERKLPDKDDAPYGNPDHLRDTDDDPYRMHDPGERDVDDDPYGHTARKH